MAVTVAGWLAIVAGTGLALMGLFLFGAMFSSSGIPVGGARLFAALSLGLGPVLMLTGVAIVFLGFKLMGGYMWARTALEVACWVALCMSIGWLLYSAIQLANIDSIHLFQGAMFFLITSGPAIVMILLLRSDAIRRAMTR